MTLEFAKLTAAKLAARDGVECKVYRFPAWPEGVYAIWSVIVSRELPAEARVHCRFFPDAPESLGRLF